MQQKISRYYAENPARLGGPGVVVKNDDTKLNYKVKAYRGRSPKIPV